MKADAAQLHQAVMNLVFNARDAMPAGGTLSIAVERDGRRAHIRVQDSGCGMSEDVVRQIFEPLYTTKRNGTGLGLSVTHTVITRHGGEISAVSAPGAGTCFHILIPLADCEAVGPADEAKGTAPGVHPSRRLLLVEDEPAVAAGLAIALEDEGFEVQTVGTAAAVPHAVATFAPDVVVLDVGLPDADGSEVYQGLSVSDPSLPVIFSTGHGDQAKLEQYLQNEHVGFLLKPYELQTLLDVIDRVCEAAPLPALAVR